MGSRKANLKIVEIATDKTFRKMTSAEKMYLYDLVDIKKYDKSIQPLYKRSFVCAVISGALIKLHCGLFL